MTGLSNLLLLCRPHRRAVNRGFVVQITGGRTLFTRADGSVLEDRAPPYLRERGSTFPTVIGTDPESHAPG